MYIKQADEKPRSMKKVEGGRRKTSTSHLSSPSPQTPFFFFFSLPPLHIFELYVCSSDLLLSFPIFHLIFPFLFPTVNSRYFPISNIFPACLLTVWPQRRRKDPGEYEGEVEEQCSYHGGEDILIKRWSHPQLWRLQDKEKEWDEQKKGVRLRRESRKWE